MKTEYAFNLLILCLIALSIALIAGYHGFYRPYTTDTDADLVYVYNALLLNEGLPQEYWDHTGYVYFLILSFWFRILDVLNIVPISRLGELPGPETFEPYIAALVYAGRWLSVILCTVLAAIFYFCTRLLGVNRYITGAMALIFSVSPGLVTHSKFLHTELPSAMFVFAAFLSLMAAIRWSGTRALAALGLSAFFAVVAMMAKIQAVFTLLGLPVLALVFGARQADGDPDSAPDISGPFLAALVIFAAAFSIPAQVMIWSQVFLVMNPRYVTGSGGYQIAIVIYVVAAMVAYAWLHRKTRTQLLLGLTAVSVGVSLGMYIDMVSYTYGNLFPVVNFIEHMSVFATGDASDALSKVDHGLLFGSILQRVQGYVVQVLVLDFLSFRWGTYPLQPAYWAVALGITIAIACGKWRLALCSGSLLGLAVAVQIVTGLRGWSMHYYVYAEPWILLALALLMDAAWKSGPVEHLRHTAGSAAVILSVSAVFLIFAGSNVKVGLQEHKWQSPDAACLEAPAFMKRLKNHFCWNRPSAETARP